MAVSAAAIRPPVQDSAVTTFSFFFRQASSTCSAASRIS